jgi:hypothetical protein
MVLRVGPKATHNLASRNSNPIIIGDQITGFGEVPCLDIFSCRHRGETVREDFIFLSPAPGDMPHLNFFFLKPIWRTWIPSKPMFSPG